MLAAIDIGSNTVRMLLGEVVANQVRPHRYEREITRLKGGQTSEGLATESMERTFVALRRFKLIAEKYHPDNIIVVGTEALRSACNGNEFKKKLKEETGLVLEIISGEEEGRICAAGVLSALHPSPAVSIIIDIGGGSTEVILVRGQELLFRHSCPLGVVRLAEMESLRQKAFITEETAKIRQSLAGDSLCHVWADPDAVFVGTAGTITTLAALDMEMSPYDWEKVNNYRIDDIRIEHCSRLLSSLTVEQRESLPGMEKGRGDLILPGLTVLSGLMKLFGKKEMVVSDFGLLEGLLLQMASASASD